MCLPGCHEAIARQVSRRGLFKASATLAAGAAASSLPLAAARAESERRFSRIVDLTHVLDEDFPTFFGVPGIEMERLQSFEEDGFNQLRWKIVEHSGTHLDAPIHFSKDGLSAEEIPLEQLVVPLVVIDFREKSQSDPDAQLRPEDLKAWEAEHGEIPAGSCVAMWSGWDEKVGTEDFRNADDEGVMHFPGFHLDAAAFLMERGVVGLGVDTLSLDHGASADFATHYAWLPSNRWGIECLKNLGEVPASGASLVLGHPKIGRSTGGPSRVLALV